MGNYENHELVIKNMICSRCLKVVRQDLEALGVEVLELRLGKLKIRFPTGKLTIEKVKAAILAQDAWLNDGAYRLYHGIRDAFTGYAGLFERIYVRGVPRLFLELSSETLLMV